MTLARGVAAAVVGAALLAARPSRAGSPADEAAAESLFTAGKALMHDQRYDEACAKLDASRRLSPGIGITMWLADCHEHAGRLASAWLDFREAASLARAARDGRVTLADARSAALEPRLARLRIGPSGYPGDVYRDDVKLPPGMLDSAIPIDTGKYRVRFVPRSGPARLVTVDVVDNGRTHDVRPEDGEAVAVAPAAGGFPAPAPAPAGAPSRPSHVLGWVLVGVAAVGVGVGTGFGLDASSSESASNDGHCTGNLCDAEGVRLRDDAFRSATVSTVAFAVGLAAVAVATLDFVGVFAPRGSGPASGVASGSSRALAW